MLFRDPFATRVHPRARPPPLCLAVSLTLSLVCVCVSLSLSLSLSPTTLCWAPRVANLFGQVWVGTRRAQRPQRPGVTVPGGDQCGCGAPLWRWRKHQSNIEAGTPRLLLPHSPNAHTHTHSHTAANYVQGLVPSRFAVCPLVAPCTRCTDLSCKAESSVSPSRKYAVQLCITLAEHFQHAHMPVQGSNVSKRRSVLARTHHPQMYRERGCTVLQRAVRDFRDGLLSLFYYTASRGRFKSSVPRRRFSSTSASLFSAAANAGAVAFLETHRNRVQGRISI